MGSIRKILPAQRKYLEFLIDYLQDPIKGGPGAPAEGDLIIAYGSDIHDGDSNCSYWTFIDMLVITIEEGKYLSFASSTMILNSILKCGKFTIYYGPIKAYADFEVSYGRIANTIEQMAPLRRDYK